MKCNSNVLDVKHVATAHKSKDKPQQALLILGKLVREDKGWGNKRHLTEFFICVLNDEASFRQLLSPPHPQIFAPKQKDETQS